MRTTALRLQYDGTKIVYVSGTLAKVEWANPHIHFYVSVKDSDGKVTLWNFEGSATTLVERNGTHRSDLLANLRKEVTVRAVPARTVPNRGAAETVKTRGWRGAHRRRPEIFRRTRRE